MKYSAYAECEIIHFVNCEILLPLVAMWNEFAHICGANISQRSYFTCPQGQISLKKAHIVLVDKSAFFVGGEEKRLFLAKKSCAEPFACEQTTAFVALMHFICNEIANESPLSLRSQIKKDTELVSFFIWRRREDLNFRAGYPTYTLSRGASSATWVLLQKKYATKVAQTAVS